MTPDPAVDLAPFSRWTLRDKAAQRRSPLRAVHQVAKMEMGVPGVPASSMDSLLNSNQNHSAGKS
jgi:hypothetical protein